jgi:hypothetical protein
MDTGLGACQEIVSSQKRLFRDGASGSGLETMNTILAMSSSACVPGFRARGLRARPRNDKVLYFLTSSFAGVSEIG